jgi:outer membrane protein assembly factor BamD (BamD/ComL family)
MFFLLKGDNVMKAKYLQLIGLILIVSFLIIGCAGKTKIQSAPQDPAVLYTEGMVLFNTGKYKAAIEIFTRLKDYFPSDEFYAPKADIRNIQRPSLDLWSSKNNIPFTPISLMWSIK